MDKDDGKTYVLTGFESNDGDWSVQVLVQDGKLVVLEDIKDEGVDVNYEHIFMGLVDILNDKISFEFMNKQGLTSMDQFLRERNAKLN